MCAPAPSETIRSTGPSLRRSAQLHVPDSPGIAIPQTTDQQNVPTLKSPLSIPIPSSSRAKPPQIIATNLPPKSPHP
jgi:hypothetical protein